MSTAFSGCSGLTSVTIPDSVTSIGASAFSGCSGLTSVTIPDSVTSIGSAAFRDCSGLTSVTIFGNVTNDYNSVYATSPFSGCMNLSTLVLGGKMTKIGDYAFEDCSGLTSVTIPDSVTNIGHQAFAYCSGLTSVTIGNGVTSIGNSAFAYCSGLTSVTIPDSVTSILDNAFCDCIGLRSVAIFGNVTNDYRQRGRLRHSPFSGCTNLSTLVLGGKMTKIGDCAFGDCSGLTSVTIPDSVTSIGSSAFRDCSGLTNVTFFGNITNDYNLRDPSPFSGCTNLSTLVLGGKMTKIGSWAFRDCSGLTSVMIPDSVTSIGNSAFYYCIGLSSVTIGNGVTNIGGQAFAYCSGLTSVMIPDSVTSIGWDAFWACGNLTSVTISDSVTSIDGSAFGGCRGLTSVIIPDSVTSIGQDAFRGCSGLTSVTFEGTPPHVEYPPFFDVAPDARGYYTAAHAAEWEAVIVDGKWQGLIMEMIGGMIDPPVLQVQSANPAAGSLTLAWEDSCVADGITYSIYRSANDTYSATDLVADGLTVTTWTDTNYWAAEPVLKPLNYWVVADGGGYGQRISNREETRHRYALSVGVGRYRDSAWSTDLSDITYANLFYELVKDFSCEPTIVLTGQNATKAAIRREMQGLAQRVKTGDYLFVVCSSHGTTSSWRNLAETWWEIHSWLDFKGIAMYDTLEKEFTFENLYTTEEIKSDLEQIFSGKNGVSFAFLLNCCMSGGVVDFSPSNGEIAWITSCQETELTPTWTNAFGTPLPKHFFDYGWNQGRAWHGDYLTLADLVDYAIPSLSTFFLKVEKDNTPVVKGENILEHFIVGRPGNASHAGPPSIPSGLTATSGKEQISVSWTPNADTDCFLLRRTDPDGSNPMVYVINGKATSGKDKDADRFGKTYLYSISAMNEHGITSWSRSVPGSRVLTSLVQWISDIFGFDDSTPAETLAAAAASASANGTSYEACFIADIDPNDPDASFEAELVREDGKWKAKPKGGEKEGRVYRVEGKKEMSDEYWTDVTDVEGLEAEGWHFFRVGVELAE